MLEEPQTTSVTAGAGRLPEPARPVPDPLREIRRLRWKVRIGVLSVVTANLPVYHLFGFSLNEILIVGIIGWVISIVAIETAFYEVFKLRKRSSYPNVLLVELGAASGVEQAARAGLEVLNRLLGTRASMAALRDEHGGLRVVASAGELAAGSQLLTLADEQVQEVLRASRPVTVARKQGGHEDLFSALPPDVDRVVFAPILAIQRATGVMMLAGAGPGRELRDSQLMLSIGIACGLLLENLRQQESLREGQERLRRVITGAPVVLFALDGEGRFTLFEGSGLDPLGVAPEEVIGSSAFDIYAQMPEVLADFLRAYSGKEVVSSSQIAGVAFESRLSPVRDAGGNVTGIIGVATEVTERRRAEAALRESEERMRTILSHLPVVIYAFNAQGVLTFADGTGLRDLKLAPEDVVGYHITDFISGHPQLEDDVRRALAGEEFSSTMEHGGFVWEANYRPVKDSSGNTTAVIAVAANVTERVQAAQALKASEERYRGLVENANDIIFAHEVDGRFLAVNGAMERILGYSREELLQMKAHDVIAPGFRELADRMTAVKVEQGGQTTYEIEAMTKDGRRAPLEVSTWLLYEGDRPVAVHGIARDITDRKQAEAALRASEERYRRLFEMARDFIYTISPDGTLTALNAVFEEMTGWSREEWRGKHLAPLLHPGDLPEFMGVIQRIAAAEAEDGQRTYEWRLRKKSGQYMLGEFAPTPIYENGKLAGILGVVRDITERKKAEQTIRQLAFHDALTGLPNRTLFEDRLRVALAQAHRGKQMLAVMFLDLDRFKLVNDTLGHSGGDALLKEVAEELRAVIREGDSVARVGGDEFTFLLPGIKGAEDVIEVAERILQTLKRPRYISGQEFLVTTSIGITLYPQDGTGVETLLRNADAAMYRAKERGRDNYQLYTAAMNAGIVERVAIENDLRHALERGELRLLYQPIAAVASGEIAGAEALLRWEHPRRGLLGPADFLAYAEESGLIVPIGQWVLQGACRQARRWRHAGFPLWVAVNLSARQLQEETLVQATLAALQQAGLKPEALQLEITEGAVMKNMEFSTGMLQELRDAGVGIFIDDFGTGYSSLSYLKRFPIDAVKIDRSFVSDLAGDPNDAAIVSTIIAMARNLGLRVIAEGVETVEQLEFLRREGCDQYQGYLLSPPAPASAFTRLLKTQGPRNERLKTA